MFGCPIILPDLDAESLKPIVSSPNTKYSATNHPWKGHGLQALTLHPDAVFPDLIETLYPMEAGETTTYS